MPDNTRRRRVLPVIMSGGAVTLLPGKSSLQLMDISYLGSPFVHVTAKAGITTNGLDNSYLGSLYWSVV